MQIFEIPGKIRVDWNEEVKAVIDTWSSYFVILEEFIEAVLVKVVEFAKARGVKSWIVDSSQANGVFEQELIFR
ncbi:MAG: hypothetical protein KKD07_02715 [Candidatus Omnitrophica bacterium]|nr:hypothetical protein [Candidatus Omnitrophota bacterium]MBU1996377.1 hypothetical protein [Candidatus Omnitrophota bacterium]MBU4333334.1 hypothetical protein [Candidatus Omnitrophota bacterium]